MSISSWVAQRMPTPVIHAFARPYVAGASLDAAIACADTLHNSREICSTLDVLGEHVETEDAANQALEGYLEAAREVASRPHISLSIKPGHFGHYVSVDLCEQLVRRLATVCQAQGTRLTIDMEDIDLTDATLDLYRRLRPDYSVLGTVLQARLFRTEKDVLALAGLDARVRLCIGVYDVSPEVGYTDKGKAKANLLRILPDLIAAGAHVELASHDEQVVVQAREIAKRLAVPQDRFEFQMLLGVPRKRLQDQLVSEGETVRLYVPFAHNAAEGTAYLRRRLAESPSMAFLVARNLLGGG